MLTSCLGAVATRPCLLLMELAERQMLMEILELLYLGKSFVVSSDDLYELFERSQAVLVLSLRYGIRSTTASGPVLHNYWIR